MRERRFKRWVCSVLVLTITVLCGSTAAMAQPGGSDSKLGAVHEKIAAVLLPGTGQAYKGHYTKAALFASAAVFSGAGLFLTQIHYNRALERYENEKRIYLAYPTMLQRTEVSYSEITATRAAMQDAYNQADERATWRNVFLGALVATYGLNLLDLLLTDSESGEVGRINPVSLEVRDGDVRLVKTFEF